MITNRSVSLSDQIFDQLENDILTGVIPRGSIITETQISERLGVSRTPVREAMGRLIQDHMVEETGKGNLVVGITDEDAACIYDIRTRIEGMAARLAAKNAGEEQLRRMKEAIDVQQYYHTKGDSEKIREQDSRFHELMYKASGSTILNDTLSALHRKVQKYRMISVTHEGRAGKSIREHQAIYDAIAAHDGDLAEQLATEHVISARKSIVGK